MTREELEDKHSQLLEVGLGNTEEELAEYWFSKQKEHTKLSIQFAIEVLEELHAKNVSYFYFVGAKVRELKQYLENGN